MVLEALLSALGIECVKGGLGKAMRLLKSKYSEKEYKRLLSTALRELLKESPDVSAAEASILAAEATGVKPSPELLRTRDTLDKVKRHTAKKAAKKAAKRKVAKKVARKRASKRKSTRKKAARKS